MPIYNILVKFMINSYNLVKLSKSLLSRFNMSSIKFSFKLRDGSLKQVQCKKGQHILDVAKANDV